MNEFHYTEKICKVNAKSENARCFICVYGMHNSCFHESKNYGIIKSNIFFTDKKTETMKIKDFGKYFSGNLPCLREIFLFREGAKDIMTKKEKVTIILDLLREHYLLTKCYLNHENPWQLLIATILSAQCTDDRVNLVTKDLFQKYTSIQAFAEANQAELEQDIHSIGFYHNKAKNIIACCQKLLTEFGGEVPSDLDELTSLAGVGRKTANVVRGNWYGIPSIVVDTHVKRVSNLLGLTKNQDPVKIEFDLMKIVPKDKWIDINTQMIAHGRKICIARRPKCAECFLFPYCTGGQALQKKKS